MEDKLNSLMNEQFDPTSHPSFHELTTLLDSTRSEDGGEERDDDIHVERVKMQKSFSYNIIICCVSVGSAVIEMSSDWDIFGKSS